MDFDTAVKLAIYRSTASTGTPPTLDTAARQLQAEWAAVREACARLRASRVLFLEPDGAPSAWRRPSPVSPPSTG
jgi:DNA-binding GntR family transcriptional regulator